MNETFKNEGATATNTLRAFAKRAAHYQCALPMRTTNAHYQCARTVVTWTRDFSQQKCRLIWQLRSYLSLV